jgi:amino acid transporter
VFLLHALPAIPGELQIGASAPVRNWLEAVLVLMFAYGGFEGAVIPMAEAKDPRLDAPFALFAALATVTLLFCAIQYVVVAVLSAAAATERPLAAAAQQFAGTTGAVLISAGALISVFGYLTAQMLHAPRLTFALGEKGDFPRFFARIHSRYQTPHISILVFAAIVWCLAGAGNFKGNVILSSVGRLFIYGFTCASLPVLRRKNPTARAYRLPAGNVFAVLGVFFVALLASRMSRGEGIVVLVTMAVAIANWLWARNWQNGAA